MVAKAVREKSEFTQLVERMRSLMAKHGFDKLAVIISESAVHCIAEQTVRGKGQCCDVRPEVVIGIKEIDQPTGRDACGESFQLLLEEFQSGIVLAKKGLSDRSKS